MKFTVKLASASALAALALAGTAGAATVAVQGTPAPYSAEGLALYGITGTLVNLPQINVTLGQDYSLQDRIDVVTSGATIGNAAGVTVLCDTAAATFPITATGGQLVVAAYPPGTSGNTVSFRVTQKNVLSVSGYKCTISGLQATAASMAAIGTGVNVSWGAYATAFAGTPLFDSGSVAAAVVNSQFGSSATRALAGVIDPNTPANGTNFLATGTPANALTPATTATADYLTITDVDNATYQYAATVSNVSSYITGNYNYSVGTACNTPAVIALNAGTTTLSGVTVGVTNSCTLTTVGTSTSPFSGTKGVVFGTNLNILQPQTFTGNTVFTYSANSYTASKSITLTPGAWTYAGARVYIPYMPLGGGNTGVITMANRGTVAGASVTVAAFNEAGVACSFTALDANNATVTIPAGTVVRLSDAILKGLKGCYGSTFGDATASTARVAMTLTTNAPAKDIEVYSATTGANGSRVTIVNTSNGRVVANSPGTP